MKRVRVTLVPLVIAAAAFFVVLPRTGGDVKLTMTRTSGSYAFEPDTLKATEDARILVVNDTDATHTVTAVTGEFDLTIQPGDSRFLEIDGPVAIDFYCRYHGSSDGMAGSVTLGEPETPSPLPTATSSA